MASDDVLRGALKTEASRIAEDSLYSSRGHFQAAVIWARVHLWIGLPIALLAAVGGAAALKDRPVMAAVIGTLVAALTAGATFLNPSGRAQTHQSAGVRFNSLRNQARMFREIALVSTTPLEELRRDLTVLASRRDELNEAGPEIPPWAFRRAKRSIASGDASYAVDSTRLTSFQATDERS